MTASVIAAEWYHQCISQLYMAPIELIQPLLTLVDSRKIEVDPNTGLIRPSPVVTGFGLWDVVYACPFKVQSERAKNGDVLSGKLGQSINRVIHRD